MNSPVDVNFRTWSLDRSTTKTFPVLSTATPSGSENRPYPRPPFPHCAVYVYPP
jgi:hypothetical protein